MYELYDIETQIVLERRPMTPNEAEQRNDLLRSNGESVRWNPVWGSEDDNDE